jgi:predicted lipid-binding transport protein (Tim44 family)
MGKNASYSDVLEAAGKFGAEEMEEISEILHKRAIEIRRKEIAAEIKSARADHKRGRIKAMTVSEIMGAITL